MRYKEEIRNVVNGISELTLTRSSAEAGSKYISNNAAIESNDELVMYSKFLKKVAKDQHRPLVVNDPADDLHIYYKTALRKMRGEMRKALNNNESEEINNEFLALSILDIMSQVSPCYSQASWYSNPTHTKEKLIQMCGIGEFTKFVENAQSQRGHSYTALLDSKIIKNNKVSDKVLYGDRFAGYHPDVIDELKKIQPVATSSFFGSWFSSVEQPPAESQGGSNNPAAKKSNL